MSSGRAGASQLSWWVVVLCCREGGSCPGVSARVRQLSHASMPLPHALEAAELWVLCPDREWTA